jgi:hypothetical protein
VACGATLRVDAGLRRGFVLVDAMSPTAEGVGVAGGGGGAPGVDAEGVLRLLFGVWGASGTLKSSPSVLLARRLAVLAAGFAAVLVAFAFLGFSFATVSQQNSNSLIHYSEIPLSPQHWLH